jgi:hypothetical protein
VVRVEGFATWAQDPDTLFPRSEEVSVSGPVFLSLDAQEPRDELSARVGAKLQPKALPIGPDRSSRQVQVARDLFVGKSLGRKKKYGPFTIRELTIR